MTDRPRRSPLAPLLLAIGVLALAPPAAPRPVRALGAALPRSTAGEAIRAFRKAWKQDLAPVWKVRLSELAAHDEPEVVDALIDVLESRRIEMFPRVRAVLGSFSEPRTLDRLVRRGLGHLDETVRTQVLIALGEARPPDLDWEAIARTALDDPMPPVRAAAVAALGRARAEWLSPRLTELAADPSERVRMEVPAALVRLVGVRALAVLDALASDPRWRVRLAVIEALADLKSPEATSRLVDVLERERGRLREDAIARLERLTGQYHGLDVDAWRTFLAQAPDSFLADADTRALSSPSAPRYAGGLTYHQVRTTSRRFVCVTDRSGSMETPVLPHADTEPISRIALAKRELAELIESLDDDVAFNLVTFSDRVSWWRAEPVLAHRSVRAQALAVVAGYRAEGSTDIARPLAEIFDRVEEALDARANTDADVDTLFLLSDGVPTIGPVRDLELLLAYVTERARPLKLRIHCISLTRDPVAVEFLRELAERTGGQFVQPVASAF